MTFSKRLPKLGTIHVRHPDVRYNRVESRCLKHLKGKRARFCRCNFVVRTFQHVSHNACEISLIVYHQDAGMCHRSIGWAAIAYGRALCRCDGQSQREYRPNRAELEDEIATMFARQRTRHGKPKPGADAVLFGSEEGLEQPRAYMLRNARA